MKPLLICLYYGISSTLTNISNKYLINNFNFKCSFIMLLIQCSIAILFIEGARRKGVYKDIPKMSITQMKRSSIMTLAFMGNIIFGLIGMTYVNLPMYVSLRKQSTVMVYISELYLFKKPIEKWSTVGVLMISLGAVISAINDYSSSLLGYLIVLTSNVMNTGLLYSAKKMKMEDSKNGAFAQLYYTAILSIPFILISIYYTKENVSLQSNPYLNSSEFLICLVVAGCMAFNNNFGCFLCATQNSPMATTVTGNVKDIVSVFIGLLAFSDVKPTPLFLTGIIFSATGALLYSATKLKDLKTKKE
ncbi:unnamed protein product [Blepharisma stoltei]|uniref:Sugar phosphate transporter domain-containing protein n=1 Tax=Blepharisma stoltei TaxID=1481888 RepID=A0AAU9IWE4_9CILI|nr:unnamed protein product [Blepharisma stoltei]